MFMEIDAERKEQRGEHQVPSSKKQTFTSHWHLATFILNYNDLNQNRN